MMPAADSWRQPDRRFVVTGSARPRDIRDLMGRPFFALGHMARLEPLRYRSRQMEIVVEASAPLGMATIRDADILLWLTGQIVDALNHDLWVSRHVRFTPWRLFQDLGWADGTHQYRRLHGALARLAETRVTTSLRQGPGWREKPFAWISDVRISREDGVALTLPDWLMEMACDRSHVLSVDPAYFRLYGGLERWLYRLARRHAGRQKDGWRFDLRDLHARSGTLSPWRNFVIDVVGIARRQVVPGYECKVIYGGKQPVLRISPTVSSTGSVDNRVKHTVGQDADHTIAHGAEIPLLTVQKASQRIVFKSGIGPVTYITNIITYYVGDSGLSVPLPAAPVRAEKKAREAAADRMVGVL